MGKEGTARLGVAVIARFGAALIVTAALSACVTLAPSHRRSPQDPWESWNRGVYKVNDKLDRAVAKPVARGYVRVVPQPIRTGVSNFFSNLRMPTTLINDMLQGKFSAAGTDLGRLLLNTTVGLGGILDPATSAGLDHNHEDFGLTFGHWGVHAGPFVELPILGPSDLRDAPARAIEIFSTPTHYVNNNWVSYGLFLPDLIDARAALLPLDETISHAYDPYAVVRDAYLARRAYLITGKSPEEEPLEEPGADESSAPAQQPAPQGQAPPQSD